VTAASGKIFGIVGALSAFPRRLAAREVQRQKGQLRRGITRRITHLVFGHGLLDKADEAAIEVRYDAALKAGRQPLSENGFLRLLGLSKASESPAISRKSLLEQSQLPARALDMLALFDAFENDAEPFSFRDLILSRKYVGLLASGATWSTIARSVHRSGSPATLTAQALQFEGSVYARRGERLSELDGQLLLGLETADDELEELFWAAENAEAAERFEEAAALYNRCLSIDPGDSVAAFNRANCLRAAGRPVEAAHDYSRAIKLDRGFVEAWFNLAGLLSEQGRIDAARRHLQKAIALDADYGDAVFNLAKLEYDAGNLAEARRCWARYLELDSESDWARTAARGVQFVDLSQRMAR
jgi:tetratricopeptide (TPR) repeat protein